jgi:hypothetical protein
MGKEPVPEFVRHRAIEPERRASGEVRPFAYLLTEDG